MVAPTKFEDQTRTQATQNQTTEEEANPQNNTTTQPNFPKRSNSFKNLAADGNKNEGAAAAVNDPPTAGSKNTTVFNNWVANEK